MKYVVLAIAAISLVGCASVTQTASTQTPVVSNDMPHMKRPNLVVKDLERSLAIYEGVLGLQANDISISGENSFSYPVFNIPRDAQIRGVTLNSPRESRVLALTELASLDLPKPHSAPFMSTVVIGITDLEAKFTTLEAMGLTITESRIADGAEFTFIEQAFVDPDGHLIVCYEVLT